MSKTIFRQKSMEKITFPEQMNDYIRVSNPGVWMILAAVIVLLAGVCVWGAFGRMDTAFQTGGMCRDGQLIVYVGEKDFDTVGEDAILSVDGKEYALSDIAKTPAAVDDKLDSYLVHLAGLSTGDWAYTLKADTAGLQDGTYTVTVITDRVKPLDFVLN